jgi:hypothetical protein
MKAVYKQHGNVYAGFLQNHYPNLYLEGLWLYGGDWEMRLSAYWDSHQNGCDYEHTWETERVVTKIHRLRQKGVPLYAAIRPKTLRCTVLGSHTNIRIMGKRATCCRYRRSCQPT